MCSIIGSANIELAACSDFLLQKFPYLLHFQCLTLNASMEFVENKHSLSIDHRVQVDFYAVRIGNAIVFCVGV